MIPYEELAAALAGAPPSAPQKPKFVQQHTAIDHTNVSSAPDDSTLSGLDPATGEVAVDDLISEEEV